MQIITDKNITFKAKGIYFVLKELMEQEVPVSKQFLYDLSSNKSKAVDTGWRELIDNGYLEMKKANENGKLVYKYKLLK